MEKDNGARDGVDVDAFVDDAMLACPLQQPRMELRTMTLHIDSSTIQSQLLF